MKVTLLLIAYFLLALAFAYIAPHVNAVLAHGVLLLGVGLGMLALFRVCEEGLD